MKRFLKNCILLGCIVMLEIAAVILLSAKEPFRSGLAYLTGSTDYVAGEGEAERYITVAQEQNGYTKLILGDSVCGQLFDELQEYNDEYCLLGNNRGLTVAGNYLLAVEFLKNHPDTTDLYLLLEPDTLESTLDAQYGYSYVVIPFSKADLLQELKPETLDEMDAFYGAFFTKKTVVKLISDSSVNRKLYLNYIKQKNGDTGMDGKRYQLSNLSALYLKELQTLCGKEKVALHFLPAPMADTDLRHTQINALPSQFEEQGLFPDFKEYFELVRYYPKEQFPDETHFGGDYDNQDYFNQIIDELYLQNGYMEGLCLE